MKARVLVRALAALDSAHMDNNPSHKHRPANPASNAPDGDGPLGKFKIKIKDSNGNILGAVGTDDNGYCKMVAVDDGLDVEWATKGHLKTESGSYLGLGTGNLVGDWVKLHADVNNAVRWTKDSKGRLLRNGSDEDDDALSKEDSNSNYPGYVTVGVFRNRKVVLVDLPDPGR